MFKESYIALTSICVFIFSFVLTVLINRLLIYLQLKKKEGQSISKYLINSHQNKKNTPTLGGVGIVISILVTTIFYYTYYDKAYFRSIIFVLIVFFLIGFFDDGVNALCYSRKLNEASQFGTSFCTR